MNSFKKLSQFLTTLFSLSLIFSAPLASYAYAASVPTVTNPTVTNITSFGGILGGTVVDDTNATLTIGICYGINPNPDRNGNGSCTATTGGQGVFSQNIQLMSPSTTYHFRAYATNGVGTGYSTDATFTTLALAPTPTTAPTATPTPTRLPTPTPTRLPTPTPTRLPTPTPTRIPTPPTATPIPTETSATPTPSPTPTNTPTPAPTCTLKHQGDANCDNIINILDFNAWRDDFLNFSSHSVTPPPAVSDFNGDGTVSILDFNIWRDGFLATLGIPSPVLSTTPTASPPAPTNTSAPPIPPVSPEASLTAPANNATFSSSNATFTIGSSTPPGTSYRLWVGSAPRSGGVIDLDNPPANTVNFLNIGVIPEQSVTILIPTNGEKIYATLWSLVGGTEYPKDYTFTAAGP